MDVSDHKKDVAVSFVEQTSLHAYIQINIVNSSNNFNLTKW